MLSATLPIHQISLPTPWPAVGPIHAYLVRQEPLTLIDAGLHTRESRQVLLDGLKAAGVTVKEIRRLLLTHAHLDHYGEAGWVQAESGAEVWLHPDEAGKAEVPDWWNHGRDEALAQAGVPADVSAQMERYWQMGRKLTLPLGPWQPLADGQRFEFEGGALEAVHLPGHALGHTGFWEAASGTLLGGDHLLNGVTPNPIMEPVPPGHPAGAAHAPGRALTLGMFLDALERVAAMDVRQVLPGHGPVITDHRTLAATYRAKHERRLRLMRDRLATGATAYAICRELYPRVKEFDIFLALSEVLAHVDLLVARGQASVTATPQGWVYSAEK